MENNQTPQPGRILYNEQLNDDGVLKTAELIYIDTPPVEGEQWMVTWLALMEDFGEGMQVYPEPNAGGMPVTDISEANDENINSFIECILNEAGDENPKEKLRDWVKTIETSEDYKGLQESECKRLISLISAKL